MSAIGVGNVEIDKMVTDTRKVILLVEDNETQRKAIRMTLEHFGFEVHEATNGLEAIRIIPVTRLDLVLTDIVMPEKDGLQVIMEIRRSQPDLPVMAMSGGGGSRGADDYLLEADAAGADKSLAKPFSARELIGAINSVLGVPA